MCRFSLPPGYTRTKPVAKPKLGPLLPVIDRILAEVPRSILYDNTKIAVAKICGDGKRERTQAFTGLVSHTCSRSLWPSRQRQR